MTKFPRRERSALCMQGRPCTKTKRKRRWKTSGMLQIVVWTCCKGDLGKGRTVLENRSTSYHSKRWTVISGCDLIDFIHSVSWRNTFFFGNALCFHQQVLTNHWIRCRQENISVNIWIIWNDKRPSLFRGKTKYNTTPHFPSRQQRSKVQIRQESINRILCIFLFWRDGQKRRKPREKICTPWRCWNAP